MPTQWPATAAATASRTGSTAVARALALAAVAVAAALPAAAVEAPAARGSIVCVVNGKKIVSDRPIPECANIEQRELNADGSLKRLIRPTPTDDERAEIERKEREAKAQVAAANDAVRRDRNLMQRYPDEAAHGKARVKALGDFSASVKNYEQRIALLKGERKKLLDEAEFYVVKTMPAKLRQSLDANEASLEAQNVLSQNQQTEIVRINGFYDAELARLRKLWAGAPAGSLGPLPGTPAAPIAEPATALIKTKAK